MNDKDKCYTCGKMKACEVITQKDGAFWDETSRMVCSDCIDSENGVYTCSNCERVRVQIDGEGTCGDCIEADERGEKMPGFDQECDRMNNQ